MAERPQQMIRSWPGIIATGLVATLTLGTLTAVGWRAESWGALSDADWQAVRFTLVQATLSALISVALAVPVARALARRQFFGRGALITLLGAPFILPVIVAVLGLLAVFGRSGIISQMLGWFGLEPVHIYGLHGVVLAHVFFNLPLATRLILQGWSAIPAERFRLAAALGFGSRDVFRLIERPMLREILPGAAMIIFVICTTSFAVALALGGGPRATTVELAIYQAFRFDFDLAHAAQLALIQFAICGLAAGAMIWVHIPQAIGGGLDRAVKRWDALSSGSKVIDVVWIGLAAVFLLAPITAIVLRGLPGLFDLPPAVFRAAGRSILVALISAGLAILLATAMAFAVQRLRRARLSAVVEAVGYLSIAASPLVMGTGLFILIFPFANPMTFALPVTALVNAVMSLPFALRAIVPEITRVAGTYDRLSHSLGLHGWAAWKWVYWPRLRRPLGFSAGLAAALSMGDLGVIALFGDPNAATLPLQLYRLMAAYRMDQAAGAALLLMALSLAMFWIFDRGGRVDVDA